MANPLISVLLLVYTLVVFGWVFKEKDSTMKAFVLLLLAFLYMYCGFGVGYQEKPNQGYIITYMVYTAVFSLSMCFFKNNKMHLPSTYSINNFSNKWALVIIGIYLMLLLLPLAQSGKLLNIIHPPAPSLGDIIAETNFEENQVSGFQQSIQSILGIFYLFAIFRYIKKPWIVAALLLLPTYIGYCNSGYLARSGAAMRLIIVLVIIYHFYPKSRKPIIISSLVVIPLAIIAFAAYVNIRQGVSVDNMGLGDSLLFLLETETYYPKWYSDIPDSSNYAFNYIYWFITLPLPGFLKPFDINVNFNALFTADVLGINLSSIQSISLPGLVNEGVFVFGKSLYFIHAVFFAFVFMLTYKTLRNKDCDYIALISIMMELCVLTCRGGTAMYSFAIKSVFMILLFSLFSKKKVISK